MSLTSRIESDINPFRKVRPTSTKIIFFSCEGVETEEKYFEILSEKIFNNLKDKVQLISVREDFNKIPKNERNQKDYDEQNKSQPRQVMERIKEYKKKNENIYKFSENPEDEFWLVIDVDDHTDKYHISEFNSVIAECNQPQNNFRLAVTNPFFEFWLYLHHFETDKKDELHANKVSDPYFKNKMKNKANISLKKQKIPNKKDYNKEKVGIAVERAEKLHKDKEEQYPKGLGSHVYLLIKEILKLSNSL